MRENVKERKRWPDFDIFLGSKSHLPLRIMLSINFITTYIMMNLLFTYTLIFIYIYIHVYI